MSLPHNEILKLADGEKCDHLCMDASEIIISLAQSCIDLRRRLEEVLEYLCDEPDPQDGGSSEVQDLIRRIRKTVGKEVRGE